MAQPVAADRSAGAKPPSGGQPSTALTSAAAFAYGAANASK
jgi:hypothetical protein